MKFKIRPPKDPKSGSIPELGTGEELVGAISNCFNENKISELDCAI